MTTLFIWDWDDTLYVKGISPTSIERILLLCLTLGRIVIITNSQAGWVNSSASELNSASLMTLLSRLPIISARSTYEKEHPGQYLLWKKLAMRSVLGDEVTLSPPDKVISSTVEKPRLNIVCFGDSPIEHTAINSITTAKSIRFRQGPSRSELEHELRFIGSCLEYITAYQGPLDISLL